MIGPETNQRKSNGRGGARKGAGRKPGSANVKTRQIADAVAAGAAKSPLEFLLSIMANEDEEMARRVDCAKAAAPYVHARLSAIDMNAQHSGEVIARVVFNGLNE